MDTVEYAAHPSFQAAEACYADALHRLAESGPPFMVGGAYAMREYADIYRDTKDLDVFCKAGDYPRLLRALADAGYSPEVTDESWLAKAFKGDFYVDIIFDSANGLCPVDDTWFEHAPTICLLGCDVKLVPAEEQIWSKMYVEDRHRFDGADINHMIRKQGPKLDWKRLLMRMEPHWELLLARLLIFRFVYPSDRDVVPEWLMRELLSRVDQQLEMPTPRDRICRGPLLSRTDYRIDIDQWDYRGK